MPSKRKTRLLETKKLFRLFVLTWDEHSAAGWRDDPSDEPYEGHNHSCLNPSDFRLYRVEAEYPEDYGPYIDSGSISLQGDWSTPLSHKCVLDRYDLEPADFCAVYNIYSDGGTFETTEGYVDLVGVCLASDTEELARLEKKSEEADYGYFGSVQERITQTFRGVGLTTEKPLPAYERYGYRHARTRR